MQTVNIHITTTTKWKVTLLQRLAQLMGTTVTVDELGDNPLTRLIEQGEKDFAESKGIILTPDELRAMTHEVA